MDARMLDQNLARAANFSQGWAWIVVQEEDWSGVSDCGAIFVPDREMRFKVNEDDWAIGNGC